MVILHFRWNLGLNIDKTFFITDTWTVAILSLQNNQSRIPDQ